MPSVANSFSRRMFSIERAVPEEPTASSQPASRYSCTRVASSWRAASSAAFMRDFSTLPSGKYFRL